MEPIKINKSNITMGYKPLNIIDMTETDDELLIKLKGKECYDIYPGQDLFFYRFLYESGTNHTVLTDTVTVLSEDENHVIHTSLLEKNRVGLRQWYAPVYMYDEENDGVLYYMIETLENHNIFPQDMEHGLQELYIIDNDGNIVATFTSEDILVPTIYGNRGVTSADCVTEISVEDTCGKKYKKLTTYQYNFFSENISRRTLLIRNFSPIILEKMFFLETKFNPYYYYKINKDENGEPNDLDIYGSPVKHCHLYQDFWWDILAEKNLEKKGILYTKEGDSSTNLRYDASYWQINVGLSEYVNESLLGSEDNFSTKLVEDIEKSLIPNVIDMERIKYIPAVFDKTKRSEVYFKWVSDNDDTYKEIYTKQWIYPEVVDDWSKVTVYQKKNNSFSEIKKNFFFDAYNAEGYKLFREEQDNNKITIFTYSPTEEIIDKSLTIATSITFSFHFRKRNEIETEDAEKELLERKQNTNLTSGNVYTDGWFINPEDSNTIWWNGYNYEGEFFDKSSFKTFLNSSALTSDLLGYLNFLDTDVFYKKKKVSQTFIRLLFYNSMDPIGQKLLGYSTVFLDATTLYSTYLKQMMYMNEHDLFNKKNNSNINLNAAVVLCSANTVSARVDTQMVVTNEYDRTKSSEGFNLYLFAEDRNLNIENGEKTIYMKVEFNHAGNGKTIPMISWPKDKNGEYISLTINNFIESLYIPIKLTYLNGKYIYYIPNAYKNENGNIDLVLFEPKIDYLKDTPDDYE